MLVQSIWVNINGDIYQTIILCQFLERFFMLKKCRVFFNAQENDRGKMIELINQASNGAVQPLG